MADNKDPKVISKDELIIEGTILADHFKNRKTGKSIEESTPEYTAGDGIKIRDNEISVKVGEGIFYDENDNICLNQGTRNTLASVSGKEIKGKLTIGETEYTVALSTTDEGQAGYITFVIEQ